MNAESTVTLAVAAGNLAALLSTGWWPFASGVIISGVAAVADWKLEKRYGPCEMV